MNIGPDKPVPVVLPDRPQNVEGTVCVIYDLTTGHIVGYGAYDPEGRYDPATQGVLTKMDRCPDRLAVKVDPKSLTLVPVAEDDLAVLLPPDAQSFRTALMAVWNNDPIQLNAMAMKYPLFVKFLDDENWPAVEALILNGRVTGALSKEQYAAVQHAASAARLPITLV